MELRFVDSDDGRESCAFSVGPLEAGSRQEIFRETSAVVFKVAWTLGDESATIALTNPRLTRADVQSVFDEISEKHHVAGIDLRFDEQVGGGLRAIYSVRTDVPLALPIQRDVDTGSLREVLVAPSGSP